MAHQAAYYLKVLYMLLGLASLASQSSAYYMLDTQKASWTSVYFSISLWLNSSLKSLEKCQGYVYIIII